MRRHVVAALRSLPEGDMYKALLTSLLSVTLSVGSALAADMGPPPMLPAKAPPPPAPTWTGCYVSAGGGAGLFTTNQHVVGAPPPLDFGGQGWMGLAGAGCDYQFPFMNWNAVVGAFGDYDFMNFKGTTLGGATFMENTAWAGGLRAGVLVAPTVLVYTNGGYTNAHVNSIPTVAFGSIPAQNYNGWFFGGGTETSLSWVLPGLFWRTEYRYSSYQGQNVPTTGGFTFSSNLASQEVFTQLVWRFNWTGGWH
jgi:outer membrane immunogenic protein